MTVEEPMDPQGRVKAKAVSYLQRRGSDAPADTVRQQVTAAFDQFEALLDTVPPVARPKRPAPTRWSPQEIAAHLVTSHEPTVEQLRTLLAGQSPPPRPVPADLLPANATSRLWEAWTMDLARVHHALLGLLMAADDRTSMAGRAPVTMVVKTPEGDRVVWIELLDWKAYAQTLRVHTLEHVAQLNRTLDDLALQAGAPDAGSA